MTKNIIIAGIPRSGSTFVCALLNRLPDVIALNETMNLGGLLAAQLRLAGPGDNSFLGATDKRRQSAKVGNTLVYRGKFLLQDFNLALKPLNCFAALLPHWRQRFSCLALVRNPLATLAYRHRLDRPMREGGGREAKQDALAHAAANHIERGGRY